MFPDRDSADLVPATKEFKGTDRAVIRFQGAWDYV